MNEEITTYHGYDIAISQDDDAESPREWDNLGTMVCWHSRYDLGDEQPKECDPWDYMLATLDTILKDTHMPSLRDELEALLHRWWDGDDIPREEVEVEFDKHFVRLPLYLYDHSGITMSCAPFSCSWDSGQVGFIYAHRSKQHELGKGHTLEEVLKAEVEVYDQYLTGDVWCYRIEDKDGDTIDSCCGFYGEEDCMSEAKSAVDYQVEQDRLKHQARLKRLIKSKVPFEHRV